MGTEFVRQAKTPNFMFGKFAVAQSEFAKYFSDFKNKKSDFAEIC